jgi:hypothetical protein
MSRERFTRECREWIRRHNLTEVIDCANILPRGGTGTGSGFGGTPAPAQSGSDIFGAAGGSVAGSQLSTQTGAGTAGIGNLLPWLYPTADYRNFDKFKAIALPAIGSWNDILVFSVEQGRCGKITQLGIDFVANGGAVYTQGILPAPLTFFIGVQGSPAIPGKPGKPFADYSPPNFQFLPGAVSAPTPINGLMLRERDEVHVAVLNNNIVVTSQFVSARVVGYSFSKKYWSKLSGVQ